MGQFINSIKSVYQNYSGYDKWEQEQSDKKARKAYLAQNTSISKNELELAKRKADVVIRATEILDSKSEDNCEDMEQATSFVTMIALALVSLASSFGVKQFSKIKKNVNDKKIKDLQSMILTAVDDKSKKALISQLRQVANNTNRVSSKSQIISTVFQTIVLTATLVGAILWGNSKQKEASRIGRFQGRTRDLNDEKNFVLYTSEQIKMAEEIIETIPDDKKKNSISKMLSELYSLSKDEKDYKAWLDSRDKSEITNLKNSTFTSDQIEEGRKEQELVVGIVKEVNVKAEEYSENMENAFDTLSTLSGVIAIPVGFAINSVLKFCRVPGIARAIISMGIPAATSLGIGISGTAAQKNSSRIGRYLARRELTENINQLLVYSEEDMKKAEHINAPQQKKSMMNKILESFIFLKEYIRDSKEYNQYTKIEKVKREKLQKALKDIEISDSQRMEARDLQKHVFRAFDEIDEMSQRYSEDVEASCEIAKNIVSQALSMGISISQFAMFFGAVEGKVPVARVINFFAKLGLKKDSSLRKSINELNVELKANRGVEKELQKTIFKSGFNSDLSNITTPSIKSKYNQVIEEFTKLFVSGGIPKSMEDYGILRVNLDKHLKSGFFAKWVRNLISESLNLWMSKKLPDELSSALGLKNWKNYKTLIGTGIGTFAPGIVLTFSIPFVFNAWLTNIQKKAGKIGIMKAMEKIDDPKVFSDFTNTTNNPKTTETNLLKLHIQNN